MYLEKVGCDPVGAAGGEARDDRRRRHVQDCPSRDDLGGRVRAAVDIFEEGDCAVGGDGGAGEDVGVDGDLVSVGDGVAEYDGGAAGPLDLQSFGHPETCPPQARHDLSFNLLGVQRIWQALPDA